MSRSSFQDNASPGHRRFWGVLIGLFCLVSLGGLALAVVASQAVEGEPFRRYLTQRLSDRLDADVEMGEIESRSLVFLSVPEIHVVARDRRWAVVLQRVNLELDPRLLLQRQWVFRSLQVQLAEVWLGVVPERDQTPKVRDGRGPGSEVTDAGMPGWLSAFLFRGRRAIAIESIRAGKLYARGPLAAKNRPAFELETTARGSYESGTLNWRLQKGVFKASGDDRWSIGELTGAIEGGLWKVGGGQLRSSSGAEVRLLAGETLESGGLSIHLQATRLGLKTVKAVADDALGPLDELDVSIEGDLRTRFPEVHQYRFEGDVLAENLKLNSSRIFQLLASQTGEPRLRSLKSSFAKGRIEWTPGLVRLSQLLFEEPQLVKLEGQVSVVGSELAGVFDLALPARLVGRFPGGKPVGFSYPAGGWSRAQIRVKGPVDEWKEDLTKRLVAQVSVDEIGVAAGPVMEDPIAVKAGEVAVLEQTRATRKQRVELLFNQLIRSGSPLRDGFNK